MQNFNNFLLITITTMVLSTAQSQAMSGGFITVGGDANGCHFSSIQDAIDSLAITGSSEIRIATNKTYTENLIVDDFSVSLIGGFDDCFDAGLPLGPGSDYAQVYGLNVALPGLHISADSARHHIEIKNMKFTGDGDSQTLGGGIVINNANALVEIENSRINFSAAVTGGGLSVVGGNTDVELTDTQIDFNTAQLGGGGIHCSGSGVSILLNKDTSVDLNTSTFNDISVGGGIYAVTGCEVSLYSASVLGNSASSHGGGIYAASGARVRMVGSEVCAGNQCYGDSTNPVLLKSNQSSTMFSGQGEGGAVYVTGPDTLVSMSEIIIEENSAYNGGAISARDGADVFLIAPSRNCINRMGHLSKRCNHLNSNIAHNSGGAIYNNGGLIEVSQFTFEENRADFGTAIYAINNDSYIGVTGSNFIRNGFAGGEHDGEIYLDYYVVRSADAIIELNHTTFAQNEAVDAVFGVASTANSHLNVTNSIVYDDLSGTVLNAGAGSNFFKCIIAHESASFVGSEVLVADPQFRDLEISDFHINAQTSPAVDFCTDITGNGFVDIDGEPGGFDDPTRPNQGNNPDARFDAGSDETFVNDIIFKDGLILFLILNSYLSWYTKKIFDSFPSEITTTSLGQIIFCP